MYATVTVIAGLGSGLILFAAFSVLDARSPFQHQYEQKNTVIITIPPRAAGQNSGKNFDPAEATVVAGQNNTVQWTN